MARGGRLRPLWCDILPIVTQQPGRRERKKAATRLALQEAAFQLFGERGYDATTVDDISDVADVSARTFFRYYATKDDVLFGDHIPRLEAVRLLLAERPEGEPVMTSVEAVLSFLSADLVANRERVLLQTRVAAEKPHVLGAFRQHHEELLVLIAEFVGTRLETPDPRGIRARVIASASMGTLLAASWRWAHSEGTEDLDGLMAEALDTLRSVVVPEPA